MIRVIVNDNTRIERARQLALAAAEVAAENRGQDILVLDMRKQTALFDFFVIATGSSRRQIHAMSEEIDHKLEDDLNDKRMSIEGYDESKWIVLDYGSVVIHLFDEETRQFYSLENLWADAEKVDLDGIVPQDAQHRGAIGFGGGQSLYPDPADDSADDSADTTAAEELVHEDLVDEPQAGEDAAED